MSEKQKMIAGEWFDPLGDELSRDRLRASRLMRQINSVLEIESEEYMAALGELCPNSKAFIRAPFYCDYGYNIYIGEGAFVNFDCVMLDLAPITIGKRTLLAPKVQLLTAEHPFDAAERATAIERGRPITIGDDCWLGGGVIVCPGVTIGDGSIVGAGSVVTKDLPPYTLAVGSPARAIKKLEKK
ncbi:MAG: sugar O-acetyltransferase [Rikenellaceae bacterium]